MMNNHLGIISCSKNKIWELVNSLGPVEAGCAYYGPEFLLAKHYVSRFSDRVIILSAKYGFLDLWDIIPDFYDVTFSRPEDEYVDISCLKKQANVKDLFKYEKLTLIGNLDYQKRVYDTFSDMDIKIDCPVKGLMQEKDICLKINQLLAAEVSKT